MNGNFDAGAWKDMAVSFDEPGSTSSEVTKRSRGDDELELIDVDVEKLPTFVFFHHTDGDGGRQQARVTRTDVVGGSDAGACRARLEARLALLSGTKASTLVPRKLATADGKTNSNGHGRDSNGEGNADGNADDNADISLKTNMMDIDSRDTLRDLVSARHRRAEQSPVVVMYHAPWCRKCSYLAPMFRRLAQRYSVENALKIETAGRRIGTDGPTFCRVDVSTWGGRYASTASGGDKKTRDGGKENAVALPSIPEAALKYGSDAGLEETGPDEVAGVLHAGSSAMENCLVCGKSGFVPCGECAGKGAVVRESSDGKHRMAVTCPACVGYKRLRCPVCGGKCYMCD